ncbi:MAG: serine hydrolase domain-containing protein [Flavisolibacter sp.]
MQNFLTCLLLLCISYVSSAQNNQRKIDSVCNLVKRYFNSKDANGLYSLTGQAFQKVLTPAKFKEVSTTNLFPLGEMLQAVYEKEQEGISKYKIVFGSGQLAMYLSLDEKDKLETLLFNEYTDERSRKKIKVSTNNKLQTVLDKIVHTAAQSYITLEATTGMSIGILKDGKTYFYHYGETEKGKNKLPNDKTIYEIGSISKTFTAILLAYAVNERKLNLNDPINNHMPSSIPAIHFQDEPVTIKMLSNHSSGLPRMPPNFTSFVNDPLNPYKNYGVEQLYKFYTTFKMDRKPGSSYDYSNLAVGTLGVILENIYKKTYEALLIEKICTPLKMNDTRQLIRKSDSARFAKGYTETGKYNGPGDMKSLAAAGAIRSTISDMLHYAKANLDNTPSTLNKAIQSTHGLTFSDGHNQMALGWHIIKPGKEEILFHNGGTGGYRSYLAINKNKKFAVVILSNTAIGTESVGDELMKWLEENK